MQRTALNRKQAKEGLLMSAELGEVKLLDVKIVQNGVGTMKDHIVDYVFKNTFPDYEDLVQEVQKKTGYKTVEKGQEEWLECTHELIRVTEDEIVIRFTKPYCG